jgi:arylsulfatase A-like enzyme
MLRILTLALATAATLASSAPASEPPAKPNVVIVFADDAGYGDLGCYGNTLIRTPNLDRMAAEGTRFTDFYVAQAVCSASRAALLTGCYPNRIGIQGALGPKSKNGISAGETTIADMLKTRGYATAIYGKWHLGHHPQFLPTRHGFDDYFGLPYSNDMWPKHPTDHSYPDLPLLEREKVVATNPDMNQLTKWYTEHAVAFIRKNKDRPFFLYVPHTMPHVPLGASDQFRGKSKAGLYGDVIEEIDWSVGQILATLKEQGLDDKTLVIFTSDNGPWLSYGPHAGSAGPLREGKGTSWEGGVREPCIVRWPGKVPAGKVSHEPWMTIDVLPTLAFLSGAELPKLPIDGKNVWPLLHGDHGVPAPQEAYYFYYDRELQAVRSGQWKLQFPHRYRSLKGPAGRDGTPGEYSMVRTDLALYDLSSDIGETTNVADRHPDIVRRLTTLADSIRGELGDSATKQRGNGVRLPGTVAP